MASILGDGHPCRDTRAPWCRERNGKQASGASAGSSFPAEQIFRFNCSLLLKRLHEFRRGQLLYLEKYN